MLLGGVGCPFAVDAVALVWITRSTGNITGSDFITRQMPLLKKFFEAFSNIIVPPFI